MASFSETGSYSGHLRLRIQVDVGDPGPSTTSVNVRLRVWVETDGWNFNDGQSVSWSGWKSGSTSFNNNLTSGDKLVVDGNWSHSVGSSAVSHSFRAELGGNNGTGSSPSVSVNWHVDGRPGTTPSAPRALRVWDIKSRSAKFDWSPPSSNGGLSITHYELHWRREVDSNYSVTTTDTSSRSLISLDRNTLYRWRVRAVNSAGQGDLADGGTFRTDVEHPAVGLPVFVDNITSVKADLNWNVADNGGTATEQSQVIVSTSSNMDNTDARVHNSTSTVTQTRTILNLTRATKYYYWIRIYNGTFWSDWTGTRDFTTDPTSPQGRPAVTVTALSTTEARMTWTYGGDNGGRSITGFDWQVSTNDSFSSLLASGTNLDDFLKDISGLTPASQYYFRTRARNVVGTSSWSAVRSLIAPQGVKYWNGSNWIAAPIYYWDGSDWNVPTSIKGRTGAGWVEAS